MGTVDYQWWAILVAVIVNMGIGALWYSPAIFGRAWQRFLGKSTSEIATNKTAYFYALIMAFVQVFVLKHFVVYAATFYPEYSNVQIGLFTGMWVWLGFVATTMGLAYIFAGRRKKLLLIDAGYYLAVLAINGVILATWLV